MQDQHRSVEKRLAEVEEVLRDLVARVVALEERLAGRTQVVVDELDELRTDVEQLKETVTPRKRPSDGSYCCKRGNRMSEMTTVAGASPRHLWCMIHAWRRSYGDDTVLFFFPASVSTPYRTPGRGSHSPGRG